PTTSPSFLSSYGHHLDLHSFPTRRSSDFPHWHAAGEVLRPVDRIQHPPVGAAGAALLLAEHAFAGPPGGNPLAQRGLDRPIDVGDRKSTRLNSSHRTISYAVFCLKKKILT